MRPQLKRDPLGRSTIDERSPLDPRAFLEQFQDHLAPRLDVYEQALYLYLVRNSRLNGEDVITVGLKSARKKLAFGVGKAGTPPSERIIYLKLKSLAKKGCVQILDSERRGTRIRVLLPEELNSLAGLQNTGARDSKGQQENFFADATNRARILNREGRRCFYCLRSLDENNYVIEHVVSRPNGDDSYRNVVAACRGCNNRKGNTDVRSFLRSLYRESFLDDQELQQRLSALTDLQAGRLPPPP